MEKPMEHCPVDFTIQRYAARHHIVENLDHIFVEGERNWIATACHQLVTVTCKPQTNPTRNKAVVNFIWLASP
jgi:hypothetical protein